MKWMKWYILMMVVSLGIALFWNSFPFIRDAIHFVLNPSAGALLNYNVNIGMIIIAGVITLVLTFVQKLTTDQALLKQMKAEQKILAEEMKKYKDHPEKLMELQKKQLEFLPKTMDITTRPLMITAVPIILFFRWFNDYFTTNPAEVFGLGWIWAYLIISIIFSIIFRKILDVA